MASDAAKKQETNINNAVADQMHLMGVQAEAQAKLAAKKIEAEMAQLAAEAAIKAAAATKQTGTA